MNAGGWSALVYASHIGAAVAGLLLALWLLTHRMRQAGAWVGASAVALGLSALWSFCVAGFGRASLPADVAMIASNLGWLWMIYRLFASDERDKSLGPIRPVVAALAFVEFLQFAIIGVSLHYTAQPEALALIWQFAITFRLLVCIGALVLVHNLYVGASQQARLGLRWPAAALAGLFLYDLNFYTIAYLDRSAPGLLADLRAAALLSVLAVLTLGFLRHEQDMRFRPSRSFAFQSISLILIGGYLVVMIVVAQGLAYIGSDYGRVLQAGFLLLASLGALTFLPSKRLRGWLRVSLAKNLFQHRYDYRSEWLRFTETIGRAGPQAPPLPERAVQAVADITDSPSGLLLTPREDGGLALAARWQWPHCDVPGEALSQDGVRFFEKSQFILDIDDLRNGETLAIPPTACPDWLLEEDRGWAMVPLLHYEKLVGMVVLARPPITRQLDWEDFDLLRVVGQQLASYLAEQTSQDALGEAQRFDEFNRRIAFVMHDIKNLASQLSLLAKNAEKHADKPEFRADMILTLRNSTDKLTALLARLGRYGSMGEKERETFAVAPMLSKIAAQFDGRHEVSLVHTDDCLVQADGEALEQAVGHLVQNAVEASESGAPVLLDLRREPGSAILAIVDSGHGMSPEFIRTRLFKPFHSSKESGFGIGAYEARELVRAMGGRLDVESREGLGTRFVLRLPLSEAQGMRERLKDSEKKVA
ncbi:MAG: XrtA/PEP-CTERM system histidine kinase PrsK [Alteraurantiacibacter sp.]